MKKQTKIWVAAIVAVVLLIGGGFWIYMEAQISIMKYLPEGDWQRVTITLQAPRTITEYSVDKEAVVEIQEILSNTKLNRGSAFIPELEGAWYSVQIDDVLIMVVKDGRVLLMEWYGTGEEKISYFEGGEDLYLKLNALTRELKIWMTS